MGAAIEVDKMAACDFDRLFTTNVPYIRAKIFCSLDYKSFKTCLEVTKSWREFMTTEPFYVKRFRKDIQRDIMKAAEVGNVDIILTLLSCFRIDVNYVTRKKETPLFMAARCGHANVVELLLDNGAKPNMANIEGDNPLIMAAYYGHKDVLQLLLTRGAEPNITNEAGFTPMAWVAVKGHKDLVQPLLASGANVNMADQFHVTPLHLASNEGHKEVVQLLLEGGAEPNAADTNGLTSLQYAQRLYSTRYALMRIHIIKQKMHYRMTQ